MSISQIQPSLEFKSQAKKAIFSIVFFAIAYALLLTFAVGLTVLCIYAGIYLVTALPGLVTLALGIGVASSGLFILMFLLKFIFKSHTIDRSHLVEINRKDEPELFSMIEEIVTEVGTDFPKKVYLSGDVNASVFYDSSFWSMFFPIRKNLQIGLGLINTISKIELKAILAHEFGHFSQKTMKLGSYVYNVNHVIYNLLYDNDSYDNLIQKWANISSYFSIFVVVAVKIIAAIQWCLRKLYDVVNRNYLGLSREMEFQADEIAAHITGYKPLANALLRMSRSEHAFNSVLSFFDERVEQNVKTSNIYREHLYVVQLLANRSNIPQTNGLPLVPLEELNRYNKSKLVIEDQWSSHPSTEDRVEKLKLTEIEFNNEEFIPAMNIFKNSLLLEETMTSKIFSKVKYPSETSLIDISEFETQFQNDFYANSFPEVFNGYYDSKSPKRYDSIHLDSLQSTAPIESLFSDYNVGLIYKEIAIRNDIEVLKQISDKSLNIKTFDYDGKKYSRKEVKSLLPKIQNDLKTLNDEIELNDKAIYLFFNKLSKEQGNISSLTSLYEEFEIFDKEFDNKYELYTQLSGLLNFTYETLPFERILKNFQHIKPIEEKLKNAIKDILTSEHYKEEITPELREKLELYLSKNWEYFGREKYLDYNLTVLFTALNNYAYLLSRGYFLIKKNLLTYQLGLATKSMIA